MDHYLKNQNARSIIQRNVMNFEDGGRGTKLLKVYITLHVKIFFFLFFFLNNILGGPLLAPSLVIWMQQASLQKC